MTNEYVMRYSLTCLLCVCTTNTNNNSNGMGECCGSLFLSLAPSVPTCTRPWLSYDDQLGVRVSRNGPFYSRPFFVFFFFAFHCTTSTSTVTHSNELRALLVPIACWHLDHVFNGEETKGKHLHSYSSPHWTVEWLLFVIGFVYPNSAIVIAVDHLFQP